MVRYAPAEQPGPTAIAEDVERASLLAQPGQATGVADSDADAVIALFPDCSRRNPLYDGAKRAFDIVGGLGLLAITAPILATAAVAVAFTSPGPVVFSQWRCGRGKRLFRCYKFRTMVVDAEQRLAQDPALLSRFRESWKLDDDPRVTPVGRWLRRLSIDELPQIINVLRGEMSIVGPRPVQPAEMEEKFGVWSVIVCLAKPGLTGLWQVSGRSQVRYRDRVALEVEYIRRRGFWYDLMLALRTIPCIITTRGAS